MIHGYDNHHDHSGVTVSELFIKAKHSAFKQEAMNYEHLDIAQFHKAVTKATEYLKTKTVKNIKAKYEWQLHYGIKKDDPLTLKHLLALIFYTDFTKLSTAFSCSFRALNAFESLQRIKQRNSAFYWMSRCLRELVELFSGCSWAEDLTGPFYTGMAVKLFISQFAMRLNSPTSTSKQLEVAVKFGGSNGTILTFDNPQYSRLRGWDCSWMSAFIEEDEVLWFGGFHRIKLICLRLLSTKQNFKEFCRCLAHFDGMMTGANQKKLKKKNDEFIIVNLIKYGLTKQTNVQFDEYILSSFEAFCQNKREIILDLCLLTSANDKIRNLLMHPIECDDTKRVDDDFTNLFRIDLLTLFPNAQSVIVDTYEYSLSMSSILSLISASNLKKIIIKTRKIGGKNWIDRLWQTEKEILSQQYAENGFDILYKDDKDHAVFEINVVE